MMARESRMFSFHEAGCLIEVQESAPLDNWWMSMTPPDNGRPTFMDGVSYEELCTGLDKWLSTVVPADAPGRFQGFRVEMFCHEERTVDTRHYRTRGDILRLFDEDGQVPSVLELVELLEFTGDKVMRVWGGAGNLLHDAREQLVQQAASSAENEARERFGV